MTTQSAPLLLTYHPAIKESSDINDLLIAARWRIAKIWNWTQGVSARNKYGQEVTLTDKQATCFCATGILDRLAIDTNLQECVDIASRKLMWAMPAKFFTNVVNFNDTRSHADVLAMFDRAIHPREQLTTQR